MADILAAVVRVLRLAGATCLAWGIIVRAISNRRNTCEEPTRLTSWDPFDRCSQLGCVMSTSSTFTVSLRSFLLIEIRMFTQAPCIALAPDLQVYTLYTTGSGSLVFFGPCLSLFWQPSPALQCARGRTCIYSYVDHTDHSNSPWALLLVRSHRHRKHTQQEA